MRDINVEAHRNRQTNGRNIGFGLVELIVVISIITGTFVAFLEVGILSIRVLHEEKEALEAKLLAEEGVEAARVIRDESWTNLVATRATGTPYYLKMENGKWTIASSSQGLINGKYTRTLIFDAVYRDGSDRIASAGTLDPSTKKLTARVTWIGRYGNKISEIVTFITNFQELISNTSESKAISYEGGTTDVNIASFPSDNLGDGDPVQSFTTTSAIEVTKIELLLRSMTASTSDVYLEIRPSATGTPIGTSQILAGTTIATSTLAWIEFRFPETVTLAAATQYTIRLRSKPVSTDAGSGSMGLLHWGYLQNIGSPYAGGVASRYVGRLSNPSDNGETLSNYDFSFRVYDYQ